MVIDDIDRKILRLARERLLPVSISDLTRPLRASLRLCNIYNRVHDLEAQGLLKTNKQRHYVLVEITEKGQIEAQLPKGVEPQ
jgi:DNA-binding PadR family transcriptional regulator